MDMEKIETIVNIKRLARVNGKTMEGVLFYDKRGSIAFHGWGFTCGVYNVACMMSQVARGCYREAYYFKCTPSGKYNETQVLF
jgi:hypothetical protein